MKFPSLMKIPNHKRFHFEPRYYDPVKEDLENRTSRIRQELGIEAYTVEGYQSRLKGSFTATKRKKDYTPLIRLVIALILVAFFVGFLFFDIAVVGGSLIAVIFVPLIVLSLLKAKSGKTKRERRFFKESK